MTITETRRRLQSAPRRLAALCAAALVVLLAAGCMSASAGGPGETVGDETSATPVAPVTPRGPVIGEVSEEQWQRMKTAGMVREGCPISRRSQLASVEVDYVDFDGNDRRGQLVVNADTAKTTARIFTKLHDQGFPIRRMESVENFNGDTYASLEADNTSAFNCRKPDQINAPVRSSPHANGRAVDINPRENPWMDPRCKCWVPTGEFSERTPGPGKILKSDAVWKVFNREGWIWQNISVADYMHFDTGYPSRPYTEPRGRAS